MPRVLAFTVLVARYVVAAAVSGAATLRLIVRRGPLPPSGFVKLRIGPHTERGAAWLGALVSLTPGTTTISVDPEAREMVLHLLDASEPEAVAASIRRDFELPLLALAGRKDDA
jgi:multicomponent K+:H+ antiporter subunit E/multicomponent Na+:H+ antiporter subunit E